MIDVDASAVGIQAKDLVDNARTLTSWEMIMTPPTLIQSRRHMIESYRAAGRLARSTSALEATRVGES